MAEMELIRRREEEAAHVDGDGEEVGAVPAAHGHGLEQARARHSNLIEKEERKK